MSDTQKRDEMLDCHSSVGRDHPYHEAMAEEMERLRNQLYLANESARSSSAEAARLGRILAALREPSDAMRNKVCGAYFSSWDSRDIWTVVIRAAVAAAEREVS